MKSKCKHNWVWDRTCGNFQEGNLYHCTKCLEVKVRYNYEEEKEEKE